MAFSDHLKQIFLFPFIISSVYITYNMQGILSYELYVFVVGFATNYVVEKYTTFYKLDKNEVDILWSNVTTLVILVPIWLQRITSHYFGDDILSDLLIIPSTIGLFSLILNVVNDIPFFLYCSWNAVIGSSKFDTSRNIALFRAAVIALTLVIVMSVSLLVGTLIYKTDPPNGFLRVDHYNRNATMKRSHLDNDNLFSQNAGAGNQKFSMKYRYQYEDARFRCDFKNIDDSDVEILWTFSGEPLLRHRISSMETKTMQRYQNSFYTKITLSTNYVARSSSYVTILDIKMLEEPLFGEYECRIRGSNSHTRLIKTFQLHSLTAGGMIITSPIGGFLGVNSFKWHINNPKETVHFEHHFNDKELQRPGYTANDCSPLMGLYSNYIYCPFLKNAPCRAVPYTTTEKTKKYRITQTIFCASPNVFGKYTVLIHRKVLNGLTMEKEEIVFEIPMRIAIQPSTYPFYEDDFVSYTFMKQEQMSLPTDIKFCRYAIRFYHWIRLILESTIVGSLYVSLSVAAKKCWSAYIRFVIVPLIEKILSKRLHKKSTRYNPLILCQEDDATNVLQHLVIPLEDEGEKVYFSEREFSELGNMPMFEIRNLATSKCKNTILVLSRNLLGDRRARFDYLDCMVVSKIEEGTINPKNVLIVRLDSCEIPNKYRDTFRKVQIVDFDSSASDAQKKSLLEIVKSWAREPSTYVYLCNRMRKMIKHGYIIIYH